MKNTENAGVAQLVEQLICNQQVGGSSPSTSSNLIWENSRNFLLIGEMFGFLLLCFFISLSTSKPARIIASEVIADYFGGFFLSPLPNTIPNHDFI